MIEISVPSNVVTLPLNASVTVLTEPLIVDIEVAVALATLAEVAKVSVTALTLELKAVIEVAVALATEELTANPLAATDALNATLAAFEALRSVAALALYEDALAKAPNALALTIVTLASVANVESNEELNDSAAANLLFTEVEYKVALPIPAIVDALTSPITATEPLTLNEPVTDVTAADDVPNELSPFAIIP